MHKFWKKLWNYQFKVVKGTVHPTIKILSFSPSSCSLSVYISFFRWIQRNISRRILVTKSFLATIDHQVKCNRTICFSTFIKISKFVFFFFFGADCSYKRQSMKAKGYYQRLLHHFNLLLYLHKWLPEIWRIFCKIYVLNTSVGAVRSIQHPKMNTQQPTLNKIVK